MNKIKTSSDDEPVSGEEDINDDLSNLIKRKPVINTSPTEALIREEFESIQTRFPFETFKFYKNKYNDWDITIHPTPTTNMKTINAVLFHSFF